MVTDMQGVRAIPASFPFSFFCSSIFRQESIVNCGLYAGTKEQEDRKHQKSKAFFILTGAGTGFKQLSQVFLCTDT